MRKPNGYWSKDKCQNVAIKYNSKKEFENGDKTVYYKCIRRKWIDEVCSHMESVGSRFKRLIYAYEFPDNFAYIGLTYNPIKRNWNHLNNKKSAVYQHIQKTKLQPKFIKITNYINKDIASIEEKKFI